MLSLNYWDNGKRHTITRGNSTTTYAFDNILRLESITQNLAGTTNDLVNSFTYIPSNQIHTLTVSNNLFRYTENANRTGQYAVNGLNQYTSVAGGTISYDTNGNLTQHGGTTYYYDDENRLTNVSGSTPATLKYDPLGRLFETTIDGVKTQYLYDGDALVAEYDSAGTLTRRYVHGDQVDEPWLQYNGNLVGTAYRRFLHADHQGSIIAHSSNSGTVLNRLAYDAFGIPATSNIERFGYTGQIWLTDLGLFYYKARIYEPRLGRFLQTDPVGYEDQMNLYAYVHNDPLNLVDSNGEFATLPLAAFGALVGATAGAASAAFNGGDIKAVASSALAGAVVGGLTGLTAGTVAAGSALSVSGFAAASVTGATASASGEAIGQAVSNGGDVSQIDGGKVAVAGIIGAASGQAGAITQAISGSAKAAMKIGSVVEVGLSPAVANAEGSNQDTQNSADESRQTNCNRSTNNSC